MENKEVKERPLGYTTKEESKKLLDLGVDLSASDHFYYLLSGEEEPITGKWFEYDEIKENDIIPCWSLGVLIDLMPKTIYFHDIHKDLTIGYEKDHYEVYYISGFAHTHICNNKFLIEAVIEMITWLIENNIQTEKENKDEG